MALYRQYLNETQIGSLTANAADQDRLGTLPKFRQELRNERTRPACW
jgi:hypothetical protein